MSSTTLLVPEALLAGSSSKRAHEEYLATARSRDHGELAVGSGGWTMEMQQDGGIPAPSSGGMEEVLAPVGDGKIDVTMAGAALEEGKNKKRTKTVRVNQEHIDELLKEYPFKPYPWEPQVLEKNLRHPEIKEEILALMAPIAATMKAARDKDEAIVKQYLAQGLAVAEVEVDDEEEA